jgi:LacI family transcriptional regulator
MPHSSSSQRRGQKLPILSESHPHRRVLVLIETSRNFEREIIEGIAQYAKKIGSWQLQFELRGFDALSPDALKKWPGDGFIARTITRRQAEMFWATKLPMVELGGHPEYGVSPVDCDNAALGRMAVEHFLDRGLRHFAYFTHGYAWWIESHCQEFREALKTHGFDCHIYPAPPSPDIMKIIWQESQRPHVAQWLCCLPRPIGIYTPGDWIAARLLEICLENAIAVPEEIAILGLENDVTVCESVEPTLSSIELDMRQVGYEAAYLLDRMMAGEKPPKDVILVPPSRVVVRQSTDLMHIENADVVHALQFIREHACTGIDVDRVAEEVGLSRSVLQRQFLKHLKRTPKSEIMRIRIDHAKTLLTKSDKVSEIFARKCGFSSLRYFTMAFCREVGMTPKAYRQTQQISHDS